MKGLASWKEELQPITGRARVWTPAKNAGEGRSIMKENQKSKSGKQKTSEKSKEKRVAKQQENSGCPYAKKSGGSD